MGDLYKDIYSAFAKEAISVISPNGPNSALADSERAQEQTKVIRGKIRDLYKSCSEPLPLECIKINANEVDDMLENIENGKFFKMLDTPCIRLLPDMKIPDYKNIDYELSVQSFLDKLKDTEMEINANAMRKASTLELRKFKTDDISLQNELDQCAVVFKRAADRLSNIDLSDHLVSENKRDVAVEAKISRLVEMTRNVDKVAQAKAAIIKHAENAQIKENVTEQSNAFQYSDIVEKILSSTDSISYVLSTANK